MLSDAAVFKNGRDFVAENVTKLPTSPAPTTGRLVYLTVADGSTVPGLYIYNDINAWVLLSGTAALT